MIPKRIDIDEQPTIVAKKECIGDFEVDLIIGQEHKEAIININERASGLLFMEKVESKESAVTEAKIVELLEEWKHKVHTITFDNGKVFVNHQQIPRKLELDYYFSKPYHNWEWGLMKI